MRDKFYYKGYLTFYYGPKGLMYHQESIEETDFYKSLFSLFGDDIEGINNAVDDYFSDTIYSIIPGDEFLESVKSCCFMDYDGYIDAIYINGYKSNLGLRCQALSSGGFLVDEYIFKRILAFSEVKVNWVNK